MIGDARLVSAGESDAFVASLSAAAAAASQPGPRALLPLPDRSYLVATDETLERRPAAGHGSRGARVERVDRDGARRPVARLSGPWVTTRALAVSDGTALVVGAFARRAGDGSRSIAAGDRLDGFLAIVPLEPAPGE